jgi:hypothetical protein
VSDPLADAFGVIVIEIGGNRTDHGNSNEGQGREDGYVEACSIIGYRTYEVLEPWGKFVVANNAVEDDLEGPRRREAHRCLEQHGKKDTHEGATIGPD